MPYRHILVATDGTELSAKAIAAAVELAHKFHARLTSLYVVHEGVPTQFSHEGLFATAGMAPAERAALRKAAARALSAAKQAAKAAGVRHASASTRARTPWSAIVRTAQAQKCDLIVMAAHGKSGLRALGSQTMKTIAHTRIPVLVLR